MECIGGYEYSDVLISTKEKEDEKKLEKQSITLEDATFANQRILDAGSGLSFSIKHPDELKVIDYRTRFLFFVWVLSKIWGLAFELTPVHAQIYLSPRQLPRTFKLKQ